MSSLYYSNPSSLHSQIENDSNSFANLRMMVFDFKNSYDIKLFKADLLQQIVNIEDKYRDISNNCKSLFQQNKDMNDNLTELEDIAGRLERENGYLRKENLQLEARNEENVRQISYLNNSISIKDKINNEMKDRINSRNNNNNNDYPLHMKPREKDFSNFSAENFERNLRNPKLQMDYKSDLDYNNRGDYTGNNNSMNNNYDNPYRINDKSKSKPKNKYNINNNNTDNEYDSDNSKVENYKDYKHRTTNNSSKITDKENESILKKLNQNRDKDRDKDREDDKLSNFSKHLKIKDENNLKSVKQ